MPALTTQATLCIMNKTLFLATATGIFLATSAAQAEVVKYTAALSGANVTPPPATMSEATAEAQLQLDTVTKRVCGRVLFAPKDTTSEIFVPLTGVFTGGSIYRSPVEEGGTPTKLADFPGAAASPAVFGGLQLTDEQITDMNTSALYAVMKTDGAGYSENGEVAGYIFPVVEGEGFADFECPAPTDTDGGADGGSTSDDGGATATGDGGSATPTPPSAPSSTSTTTTSCSTSSGSGGSGLVVALGIGVALAAASRRRKK